MTRVDSAQVELRARAVSRLLASHAGGIEVVESDHDDVVRLRFTGLCTACWMRPITHAQVLEPAFLDLEGVRAVEVVGVNFSQHSRDRWADKARCDTDLTVRRLWSPLPGGKAEAP